MTYEFIKMNGLGNDFVIFDGRLQQCSFTTQELQRIADRNRGIGCDQVIILEPAIHPEADLFMRIYNTAGQEAEACGNAARCVTWLIAKDLNPPHLIIETLSGLRQAKCTGDYEVAVDMGQASFEWDKIPLSHACNTLSLKLPYGMKNCSAVNVGNPHLVEFIEKLEGLYDYTDELESHPLFPQGINVNTAYVSSPNTIKLAVWERGVGRTEACGTGACATVAAAVKKGLVERTCQVIQEGGTMQIEINADDHIIMTGPVAENFCGSFSDALFAEVLDKGARS